MKTSSHRKLLRLTTMVVASLALSSTAWATSYTITQLDSIGSPSAYVINNSGQIAGTESYLGAFIYSNGTMQHLGTLGGADFVPNQLNDNGQVVGTAYNPERAVLYSNGTITNLGNLGSTLYGSSANGINNSGQVVGTSYNANNLNRAFLYSNGVMSDLGTLGGSRSNAYDINNSGQVVGSAQTTIGFNSQHAFLYSNGTMKDLGTLAGSYYSTASAINDNGQVVGNSHLADNWTHHAFLYSNDAMKDLGTLGGAGSLAYDINNIGQVVGGADLAGNTARHAFLYSGGTMLDLNIFLPSDSSWTLTNASDINDLGQILCYGERLVSNDGDPYYLNTNFLLTPTAVPVPSSAWLLGSGLLGLIGVARRR